MRRTALLAAFGLALAAPAGATAAPAQKAAVARDWTRTVVATPEGGFRIGNPAAPTKLIEYGSLTCNHCANFATGGLPQLLSGYVKGGKVSFEFRNFVRDPYDVSGALVSRCATPANFFPLTHQIFATQEQWVAKVQPHTAAIGALPQEQRAARIATLSGFEAMAAKAGIPAARAKQCLNDPKGLAKLVQMRDVALKTHGLEGTPTFILNGKNTGVYDWASLQPLLGPPGS